MNISLSKMIAAATLPLLFVTSTGAGGPAHSAHDHIMLTPNDVQWGECMKALPPGAQCAVVEGDPSTPNVLFAIRAKFPDNYRIAPHFHPADEHVTVLSGTFNMGMGDKFDAKATKALGTGSFVMMPKGTHHFAWSRGETIVQLHSIGPWGLTYVNPQDDPRITERTSQSRK